MLISFAEWYVRNRPSVLTTLNISVICILGWPDLSKLAVFRDSTQDRMYLTMQPTNYAEMYPLIILQDYTESQDNFSENLIQNAK